MTGTILNGNKELYDALNGKKAVIIGNGVTTDDFTTPAGVGYDDGLAGRHRRPRQVRHPGVPAEDRGDRLLATTRPARRRPTRC